jgi:predicted PurR-regulated permease PerM
MQNIEDWVNRQDAGLVSAVLGIDRDSMAEGGEAGATPGATAPRTVPPAAPGARAIDSAPATTGTVRPAPPGVAQAVPDTTQTARPSSVLRARIADALAGAVRYLFPFLSSTFAVIAGIILIIFLSIYVAAEPDVYHSGLMHLFPHSARQRAGEVMSAIATTLRKWLVTQLIAMAVIGTVTTTVLLLLDVPAALPLGLLAGLLEFVPTVGPILSAVPAITMGFVDSPEKAAWVAIAYWGIQFLENQLLIPMLMREGVDLPPALTIVAQALMAILFGFLGLLVAVPMLAALMVTVKMLYVEDVVGDEVDVPEAEDDDV